MRAKRRHLSKRETKSLISEVEDRLHVTGLPREGYEEVEGEGFKLIALNREPFLIIYEDGLIVPHLRYLLRHGLGLLPKIVVDKGAVKPIGNGADVMAPGVIRIEGTFNEGGVVVVTEERGIPIAVVKALLPSDKISAIKSGKIALNVHHPGDKAWRLSEQLF